MGITLAKQLLEELHLQKYKLTITKKVVNVELKPIDTEFEDWAKAYRQTNTDYKDVLKELTK